jgi:hypothetical protein
VREVGLRDECRRRSIRYLLVRVARSHDPINIADHDRPNLQRAKFAMTATRMIVSMRFDLDKSGQKQWMHDLILVCGLFVRFKLLDEIVPLAHTLASLLNRKIPFLLLAPHTAHHLRPDAKIMQTHHLA